MVDRAMKLAARLHHGQHRDNGIPYIIHPLEVVKQLYLWGFEKDEYQHMWVIALLHDVLEDCDFTYNNLKAEFDAYVADSVQSLTFRQRESGESLNDYKEAKCEYLNKIANGPTDILVIKMADRYCNTKDRLLDRQFRKAVSYWTNAGYLIEAALTRDDCEYPLMRQDVMILDNRIIGLNTDD